MAEIVSENNDLGSINWVNGLSDPGEMIACGYLPQLRRNQGEADKEYAERIRPLVAALKPEDRDRIMGAALKRANLDATNGKVAVMVVGEPAWHGLGVNVKDAVTSADALKLAGLDWPVEIWESLAVSPSGKFTAWAKDARHVVRDTAEGGVVLGTVGTRYEPFQNKDAFDFLDSLVGEKLAMFHTAGAINGGKTVWMQCKIPHVYYATPGDATEAFVLLANSHDGNSSLNVMPTTLRAVCANTLRLSMKNGGSERALKIRHTQSLKGKVAEARKAMGLVSERLEAYGEQMQALVKIPADEMRVRAYAEGWFPTRVRPGAIDAGDGAGLLESILESRKIGTAVVQELLEGHFAESERAAAHNRKVLEFILENFESDTARGTAWGMFNAVTEYCDHQMTNRGKDKESARLSSAWFGRGDQIKQEALRGALAMAE